MVAVVHVVLVVAGLGALSVARATGGDSPGCDRARQAAADRRDLDTGSGTPIVVVGDSYSVGAGVAPLDSWPTRLPGRVHVDGFSGSGFSAGASGCGPVSYAERAARAVAGRPGALVVVEGGLNDHDQSDEDIAAGFQRLTGRLAGHDVARRRPAARARPGGRRTARRPAAGVAVGPGRRHLPVPDRGRTSSTSTTTSTPRPRGTGSSATWSPPRSPAWRAESPATARPGCRRSSLGCTGAHERARPRRPESCGRGPGWHRAHRAGRDGRGGLRRVHLRAAPARAGRHRHRQVVGLPGPGARARQAGRHRHRDAGAAAPARRARPAAAGRGGR